MPISICPEMHHIPVVCAPNSFDTVDVRIFNIPLEWRGNGDDPGAIIGVIDIAFHPKVCPKTNRLKGPTMTILGTLKYPLRTA